MKLAKKHGDDPDAYEPLLYNNMRIETSEKNKWLLTEDNDIAEFHKAKYVEGSLVVFGSRIIQKKDFYESPLKSSLLRINASSGQKNVLQTYPLTSIQNKMFPMSSADGELVFFPMLHNE